MNFNVQELTVIGTLAGAFIGGLFGFLTAWISKRSEERKSSRELMMRVASEQFMHEIDTTVHQPRGGIVHPYQVYLVEMLELGKIANKRVLTKKRVLRLLNRAYRVIDAVVEHAVERSKS